MDLLIGQTYQNIITKEVVRIVEFTEPMTLIYEKLTRDGKLIGENEKTLRFTRKFNQFKPFYEQVKRKLRKSR